MYVELRGVVPLRKVVVHEAVMFSLCKESKRSFRVHLRDLFFLKTLQPKPKGLVNWCHISESC